MKIYSTTLYPPETEEVDGNRLHHAEKRIAELEATLREISITYNETEQTPAKLNAALYAVCKLAVKVLHKPWKGK